MTVFVSCSNNDEQYSIPDPVTLNGTLTTSIPAMPDFEPVTSETSAKITWLDTQQSSANINIGEFTIETGMAGHGYTIGAMEISN